MPNRMPCWKAGGGRKGLEHIRVPGAWFYAKTFILTLASSLKLLEHFCVQGIEIARHVHQAEGWCPARTALTEAWTPSMA